MGSILNAVCVEDKPRDIFGLCMGTCTLVPKVEIVRVDVIEESRQSPQ